MKNLLGRLPLRLLGWAAAGGFALVAGGCGGGSAPSPIKTNLDARTQAMSFEALSDVGTPPPKKKEKVTPPAAATTNPAASAEATTGPAAAPPNAAAAPEAPRGNTAARGYATALPVAPADIEQWNEGDFLLARAAGDRRLLSAVQQRAANPQRTTAEAEMLAALLRPKLAGMLPAALLNGPSHRVMPAPSGTLVQAVAIALAANNTTPARQTLAEILRGEFAVGTARDAPTQAATALMSEGSPLSEDYVVQAVLTPLAQAAPVVFSEDGPANAVGGATSILPALREHASARLRKRLAEGAFKESTPLAQRSAILAMLREPNPLNLEAQLAVYANAAADAEMRTALEKQFLAASSEALAALLKLNDPKLGLRSTGLEGSYRSAGMLWSASFIEQLSLQQRAAEKIAELTLAAPLAATIPAEAMRKNLRQFLVRHWDEGPQALCASVTANHAFLEPGLIVLLKSAAREVEHARTVSVPHFGKSSNAGAAPANSAGPANDWDKFLQSQLESYGRRCRTAALTLGNTAALSREARAAAGLIALQPDSKIHCAYHCDWPGEHASALPESVRNPWQIDYVRIEARTRASRPLSFYRGQLKHLVEHRLPNGIWLDGLSETPTQERTRSTDVVITALAADNAAGPNQERELTVEILTVDVGSAAGGRSRE